MYVALEIIIETHANIVFKCNQIRVKTLFLQMSITRIMKIVDSVAENRRDYYFCVNIHSQFKGDHN